MNTPINDAFQAMVQDLKEPDAELIDIAKVRVREIEMLLALVDPNLSIEKLHPRLHGLATAIDQSILTISQENAKPIEEDGIDLLKVELMLDDKARVESYLSHARMITITLLSFLDAAIKAKQA